MADRVFDVAGNVEIVMAVELDTLNGIVTPDVVEVLQHGERAKEPLPEHPFFKMDRWWQILGGRSSAALVGKQCADLVYDACRDTLELTLRASINKNQIDLISAFLDWLSPCVAEDYTGFCGYTRYEERRDGPSCYIMASKGGLEITPMDRSTQYDPSIMRSDNAALSERVNAAEAKVGKLKALLSDLHALVWEECPSLMNEDNGGDAALDLIIRKEIGE